MVETMCAWGVTHVFGMVGHSNLGFADAMRDGRGARRPHVHRHPPRRRGRVRGVGLRQAHRASSPRASRSPGPGSTNLLTGLYDAKVDRAPVLAISGQVPSKVRGRGAFQDLDLTAAFSDVALYSQTVQRDSDHARADEPRVQARARAARRRAPRAARRGADAARPATRAAGLAERAARRHRDRAARRRRSSARSRCSPARSGR